MEKKKKIILVTGGTSGIGFGTIQYLLEKEEYEIISVSRNAENIKNTIEKLNSDSVHFIVGDLSKEQDCENIYSEIESKYGKLDGLVNCAGIIRAGGIEEATLEEWNYSMDNNLTSLFILTKAMIRLLKLGTNPSIVNISSISSQRTGASLAYCVSKAGVDMFTKFLGKELGKYNIRVNSVNPGMTRSNIQMSAGIFKTQEEYEQFLDEKSKNYPLGKIGEPKEDLAPTIEFLLSDKSLWTTGACYIVDGGGSI